MASVMKSAILTLACGAMAEDMKHPVRQEIVDEIKLKATSWKPREVEDNHLRHVPIEKVN